MPIVHCNKYCLGNNGKKCKWDTEIQRRPAKIRDDADFCQICLVRANGEWEISQLSLQLFNLYLLDTDIFHSARRQMPLSIFDGVSVLVMAALVSTVPLQRKAREIKRRHLLTSSLNHLIESSWMIDYWWRKVFGDTCNVCYMELAMRSALPFAVKGLVIEFLCGNLDIIYGQICKVKGKCYHALENPIFWYPIREWVVPSDTSHVRTMLVRVYIHILEHYHKPKILRLKQAIVAHGDFIKQNYMLKSRSKRCQRLQNILECMLEKHVDIIASPPF